MEEYTNKIKNIYQSLCTPSKTYLLIQVVFIIFLFVTVPKLYIFKVLYILLTVACTGIYDALCKNDYELLSWALLLGILFGNVIVAFISIGKKIIN